MTTFRLPQGLVLLGLPAVVGATLLLAAAPDARAQSSRASANMMVSATVVRGCTVETPASEPIPGAPEAVRPTGEPVKIRCGNNTITYPARPVQTPVPANATDARPTVTAAPGGRTVTIQF